MNLQLVLLHLRRGLHPSLGLALLLVAAALLAGGGPPVEAGLGASEPEQVLRGLTRGSWWSALALVLLLGAVSAAAAEHQRWRRGDVLWSSTRKLGALGLVVSVWAGRTLALWTWLCLIAVGVELVTCDTALAYQPGPRQQPELTRVGSAGSAYRWSLAAPSRDALRLSVELRWRGDYTTAEEIELRVGRRGESPARLVAPPTLVQGFELALPQGEGPLDFELEAHGPGGVLGVEALEVGLLQPRAERLASVRLAASLGVLGAALLALALGCGAWMSAASTVALISVAWGLAWLERLAWPWPGLDLPSSLEVVARGRVPAPLTAQVFFTTAALIFVGLSLRLTAMRRGAAR